MKASELVAALQGLIEKHGDLNVGITNGGSLQEWLDSAADVSMIEGEAGLGDVVSEMPKRDEAFFLVR